MHLLLIVPLAIIAVTIAVLPVLMMSVSEHRRMTADSTERLASSYSTRRSDRLRPTSRIPTGDAEPIWRQWVEPAAEPLESRGSKPLIGAR